MRGDFTRNTFRPDKHYSRVLMQQGHVQLDADWNEQIDIDLHRAETEAVDVIGSSGMPIHDPGFAIITDTAELLPEDKERFAALKPGDFLIGPGRYYVDGMLCENKDYVRYTGQPDLPSLDGGVLPKVKDLHTMRLTTPGRYLVYLDVWERHITALDDDAIREKALGGPDTATRAKVVWQVRTRPAGDRDTCAEVAARDTVVAPSTGGLKARPSVSTVKPDVCGISPGAGYRGLENQLYRVEIHKGGNKLSDVTLKWSRDNGSVVAKVKSFDGKDKLTVDSLGPDGALGFAANQWIELTDDVHELRGVPGILVKVIRAVDNTLTIDPKTATGAIDLSAFPGNPKVRRWDMPNGPIHADKPDTTDLFFQLEDGVEISFVEGVYHSGDYWLIPARRPTDAASSSIEWDPVDYQPPLGIRHHYCRLALIICSKRYLFRLDQEGNPMLDLAPSYAIDDKGNWIFNLHPDFYLPNGKSLTAEWLASNLKEMGMPGKIQTASARELILSPGLESEGFMAWLSDHPMIAVLQVLEDCRKPFTPLTELGPREACRCLCTAVVQGNTLQDIQDTIDEVGEEGGLVCIPRGMYQGTGPIIVGRPNICVKGTGAATRLVREISGPIPNADKPPPTPIFWVTPTAKGFRLCDVRLQIDTTPSMAEQLAICAVYVQASDICIERVEAQVSWGSSVIVEPESADAPVKDLQIMDNRFSGSGIRISFLPGDSDVVIAHNRIDGAGIAVEKMANAKLRVVDNEVTSLRREALRVTKLDGSSGEVHVSGNILNTTRAIRWTVYVARYDMSESGASGSVLFSDNQAYSDAGTGSVHLQAHALVVMGNYVVDPTKVSPPPPSISLEGQRVTAMGNITSNGVSNEGQETESLVVKCNLVV